MSFLWLLLAEASAQYYLASSTYNITQTVSCPPGNVISAGFSLQIVDTTGPTICTINNTGACTLGSQSCSTMPCTIPAGTNVETFIWINCSLASDIPSDRTLRVAKETNKGVAALCTSPAKILFGFSAQFSTAYTTTDKCVQDNTRACTPGQQTCSTSPCANSAGGVDQQFIFLVCQSVSSTPNQVFSYVGTHGQTTLLCGIGWGISMGFSVQWGTSLAGGKCLTNSKACVKGQACAMNPCENDPNNAFGGDTQLATISCTPVQCGLPPNPAYGSYTCAAGSGMPLYSYLTSCQYACNKGFVISGSQGSSPSGYVMTCGAQGWTGSPHNCSDVNECLTLVGRGWGGCDNLTQCINTPGSRVCSDCPGNYSGNGADAAGCQVVNYCTATTCPTNSQCLPKLGGYSCTPVIANSFIALSGFSSIDESYGGSWVANSTRGGAEFAYPVTFGGECLTLRGYIGYLGQPQSQYVECASLNVPTMTTTQPVLVSCVLPPNIGWNLGLFLYWCLPSSTGIQCGWSQVVDENPISFKYPDPILTSGSLRLAGDPDPQSLIPVDVRHSQPVDELVFDGFNFLPDPTRFTIRFGPRSSPWLFACTIVVARSTDTTIHCLTDQDAEGDQLVVSVICNDGTSGGPTVQSLDTYSYGAVPELSAVYGCPNPSLEPNLNGTSDCPIEGGTEIILVGANFALPFIIFVGSSICELDVGSLTDSSAVCILPLGVGEGVQVIVQSGALLSVSKPFLSYEAPVIYSLNSDNGGTSASVNEITGFDRAGTEYLWIFGKHFGAFPWVRIGGILSTEVYFNGTNSFDEDVVSARMPPGTAQQAAVVIGQLNGRSSTLVGAPLVSYQDCEPGTYSVVSSTACASCTIGRFASSAGARSCPLCAPGFFAASPGMSYCQSCSPGYYRTSGDNNNLVTNEGVNSSLVQQYAQCKACAQGTFTQLAGSIQCQDCPLGKAAPRTGMVQCNDCTNGTYSANTGQTQCDPCDVGKFGVGGVQCIGCSLGKFTNSTASRACSLCPPGRFQDEEVQSSCKACPQGRMQSLSGQPQCVDCPEGRYGSGPNATGCDACVPGRYQSQLAKTTCLVCIVGTKQGVAGQKSCDLCTPGGYSNYTEQLSCTPCPAGMYAPANGATSCLFCPQGTSSPTPNSGACTSCQPGQFAPLQGMSSCTPCPVGSSQSNLRSLWCDPCTPGKFTSLEGSSQCETCPGNLVAPFAQQSQCVRCPGEAISNAEKTACDCPSGTYRNTSVVADQACLTCPPGANCLSAGVTIENVETLPGYWRPVSPVNVTDDDMTFYACVQAASCLGGKASDCGNARTGVLCSLCVPGYRAGANGVCQKCPVAVGQAAMKTLGLLAAAVIGILFLFYIVLRSDTEKDAMKGGVTNANFTVRRQVAQITKILEDNVQTTREDRDKERGSSRSLNGLDGSSRGLNGSGRGLNGSGRGLNGSGRGLNGSGGLNDGTSVAKHASGKDLNGSGSAINHSFTNSDLHLRRLQMEVGQARAHMQLTFPLKCLITFFQIATNLASITTLVWPRSYLSVVQGLSWVNIDFIPWQSLSCSLTATSFSFFFRLLVTTITPLGVFLVLLAAFIVPTMVADFQERNEDQRRKAGSKNKAYFWKLVLFSLFLIYPLLSTTIFSTFQCTEVNGTSYLVSDFTVTCGSASWTRYAIYSGIMIVLFPIGIPVACLFLLWRRRHELNKPLTRISFGIIYEHYVPALWWFEFPDTVHKLFLTSLVRYIPGETALRIGLLANLAYTVAILQLSPFVKKSDDRLQLLVQAEICTLMMGSFVMQTKVSYLAPKWENLLGVTMVLILVGTFLLVCSQLAFFYMRFRTKQRNLKRYSYEQGYAQELSEGDENPGKAKGPPKKHFRPTRAGKPVNPDSSFSSASYNIL